jgi:acetyl-CoA carboxylase carboxyl transferase subunit alpha
MPKPDGYRKAQRLVKMAEQFNLPIVTMVDTAGAFPGIEAEERGQSEAIARSIDVFLGAQTPIVTTVIGEGGSGGAIAIAAADKIFMLEYSIYSVISPEGCASILWRSAEYAKQAAAALRLTARDLEALGVIDTVIEEPMGGAHRAKEETYHRVGLAVESALDELIQAAGTIAPPAPRREISGDGAKRPQLDPCVRFWSRLLMRGSQSGVSTPRINYWISSLKHMAMN